MSGISKFTEAAETFRSLPLFNQDIKLEDIQPIRDAFYGNDKSIFLSQVNEINIENPRLDKTGRYKIHGHSTYFDCLFFAPPANCTKEALREPFKRARVWKKTSLPSIYKVVVP